MNWSINNSSKYFQIYLDKHACKTLYKDEMLIPSYSLAVALAEEWASQPSNFFRLNNRKTEAHQSTVDAVEHAYCKSYKGRKRREFTEVLQKDNS
jgi:hypothetical protein